MDQRSGASKDQHNVDDQGGGNEVKYRGVIRQRSGNYSARIRDPSRRGGLSFLGTYATAEEAARAYDRAAFAKEGRLAILNFPGEHGGATSSAAPAAASSSVMAATSSSSMVTQQVIEFECYDDKLLEDLLDLTSPKEGSENV